jgi:hypothetical protein
MIGWDHQFLRVWLRRLFRFRGLFRLSQMGCLGPTVTLGADIAILPGGLHFIPRRNLSDPQDWGRKWL